MHTAYTHCCGPLFGMHASMVREVVVLQVMPVRRMLLCQHVALL